MIATKEELYRILKEDFTRNNFSTSFLAKLKMKLSYNDNYIIVLLLSALRFTEFYYGKSGLINKLLYYYHYYKLRKLRVKSNIMIFPNTISSGFQIVHPGFRRIGKFVKIGKNCTVLPMVLFGRKRPTDTDSTISIGDNCYISTGATILGPVKIGNNVTIGAGAVVNKDIPDNVVVGGVPAKIIKEKSSI